VRKQANFAPRGGEGNLGVASAIAKGAGIMDAAARGRKRADEVTKLRQSVCVAHCSEVRVL
jgi:hypothetical protein